MPDVSLTLRCPDPAHLVWERLLSSKGLCASGSLADLEQGGHFSIETAVGDVFRGTVQALEPDSQLVLRIENMHGSELCVATESDADSPQETMLSFALTAVGLHHDEVECFRSRWRMQLSDLFAGALDVDVGWLD